MTWVFLGLGVVVVFAVAAAFVGSEAFRLGHEPPASIFDLDEAVDSVAEGLPEGVQARLSYDEVRHLILAVLDHLRDKGLGALPGEELPPPTATAEDDPDVIVVDDEAVAVVLRAIDAEGLDVADGDAYEVIRGLLVYLDHIGALGPRA